MAFTTGSDCTQNNDNTSRAKTFNQETVTVISNNHSIVIQHTDGSSIGFRIQDSHQISAFRIPVYEILIP